MLSYMCQVVHPWKTLEHAKAHYDLIARIRQRDPKCQQVFRLLYANLVLKFLHTIYLTVERDKTLLGALIQHDIVQLLHLGKHTWLLVQAFLAILAYLTHRFYFDANPTVLSLGYEILVEQKRQPFFLWPYRYHRWNVLNFAKYLFLGLLNTFQLFVFTLNIIVLLLQAILLCIVLLMLETQSFVRVTTSVLLFELFFVNTVIIHYQMVHVMATVATWSLWHFIIILVKLWQLQKRIRNLVCLRRKTAVMNRHVKRLTHAHRLTLVHLIRANQFYSPIYFGCMLTSVGASTCVAVRIVLHRTPLLLIPPLLLYILSQQNILLLMHLFCASLNRKLARTARLLFNVSAQLHSSIYYGLNLRLSLHLQTCHVKHRYGLTYGNRSLITMRTFSMYLLYYLQFLMFIAKISRIKIVY